MILQLLTELNAMPEDQIVGNEVAKFRDVGPNEEVKGILGLQSRKLYSAMHRQGELTNAKIVEALKMDASERDKAAEEITLGKARYDLLEEVFWHDIKEEFSLNSGDIGIRKDWQVVALPKKERDPLEELSGAFGGRIIIASPFPGMGFGDGVESLLLGLRGGKCNDPNCPSCNPKKK